MRIGIIVFPGSNCEQDCLYAVKDILKLDAELLWHKDGISKGYDLIIIPGGFSYGDYLRPGAIARFSPIMTSLITFAKRGGLILGICNGFQILIEAGLLPGTLIKNNSIKFICKYVYIRIENAVTPFTSSYKKGDILKMPIRHGDGNFYIDDKGLECLEENNQIIFRYCSNEGLIIEEDNPNGSISNIAGICSKDKKILGLMPHPETATEDIMGSSDGIPLFNSLKQGIRNFS